MLSLQCVSVFLCMYLQLFCTWLHSEYLQCVSVFVCIVSVRCILLQCEYLQHDSLFGCVVFAVHFYI